MHEVWVEKYRPKALDEVVGQKEVMARLKSYVKSGNLPHLMFAGPAGTGKTTSAMALARELFGDEWRGNFFELNASDERGIGVVRKQIKDYARTRPIGDHPFKIIFLDEADALTDDAQAALRRTMERYTQTCRFILSCNYSSKIIEPIQSRCAVFRFRPLSANDVKEYVRRIAKTEDLEVTGDGLEAITYVARGDARRVTNALQVAASVGGKIDAESVYQTTSTARPEQIKALLTTALEGDFLAARASLDDMLIDYGLSGEDIIRQIHRSVFDLPVSDPLKVRLVDRIGEAEFRMVEGSNERIQIEALLAHFVLVGSEGA
ncbi:MAG: replication factor C small subunit [Euryarchaeota archaeon]|nr:replication factor C small subunit [Euryarchaeota archaeon]